MEQRPNVISISFAKQALKKSSRDFKRMQEYATVLGEYHVIVFTLQKDSLTPLVEEGNLHIYGTNTVNKILAVFKAYTLAKKIIQNDTKIQWTVSCQDAFITGLIGLMLCRRRNTRLQVQAHGDIFNQYYFKGIFAGFKRVIADFVFARAEKIRVVSERIRSSLIDRGVRPEKIFVLPVQPTLSPFFNIGDERQITHIDQCSLLFVGRLAPEKNLPLLLDAVCAARTTACPVTLTVVGTGPEQAKLERIIHENKATDFITLKDWTNAVAEEMYRADVLCLPSFHEGYGLVILEAMAAGLPVIATDVGCAGEVLQNEKQGFVVPVNDSRAFAEAIQKICSDPSLRSVLGRAANKRAHELEISPEVYLRKIRESLTISSV